MPFGPLLNAYVEDRGLTVIFRSLYTYYLYNTNNLTPSRIVAIIH